MKIKLHHVNFCTTDLPAMDAFYRDVLGLEPEPSLAAGRVTTEGYAGQVAFVTNGQMQLHLASATSGPASAPGTRSTCSSAATSRSGPTTSRRSSAISGTRASVRGLRRLGHGRLGADLLPRPRGQRGRGAPGPVLEARLIDGSARLAPSEGRQPGSAGLVEPSLGRAAETALGGRRSRRVRAASRGAARWCAPDAWSPGNARRPTRRGLSFPLLFVTQPFCSNGWDQALQAVTAPTAPPAAEPLAAVEAAHEGTSRTAAPAPPARGRCGPRARAGAAAGRRATSPRRRRRRAPGRPPGRGSGPAGRTGRSGSDAAWAGRALGRADEVRRPEPGSWAPSPAKLPRSRDFR